MFDDYKLTLKYIKKLDRDYDLYQVVLSDEIKNKSSYKNYKIYDNKQIKIRKGCRVNLLNKYSKKVS